MKSITIKEIRLYPIAMTLVEGLQTSFGQDAYKAAVLVELITDTGISGWGDISVELEPGYGSETIGTAMHIAGNFLIPRVVGQTIDSPTRVPELLRKVRGNHHVKFGVEAAVWDAFAKVNAMRLADLFAHYAGEGHASRGYAWVGVSIGIQPTIAETLTIVSRRVDQGYQRIKLKIKPGWDLDLARAVRQEFPDTLLMLDANSAYRLPDTDHLKQFDDLDLLMIEQPLADDDIYEHSLLQPQLNTSICLDESIKSAGDLRLAMAIGACRIVNLKPVRVGGYTESLAIYAICAEQRFPLWIGGMLETGIGRAANVAFASLPAVSLPSDISATDRYYDPDLTEAPFVLFDGSKLLVPEGAGIGVEVQRDRLAAAVARWNDANPYVGHERAAFSGDGA